MRAADNVLSFPEKESELAAGRGEMLHFQLICLDIRAAINSIACSNTTMPLPPSPGQFSRM
jgi:hypothetical protein